MLQPVFNYPLTSYKAVSTAVLPVCLHHTERRSVTKALEGISVPSLDLHSLLKVGSVSLASCSLQLLSWKKVPTFQSAFTVRIAELLLLLR